MVSEISGFGGMASLPRWFLWELTWNDTKQKYTKIPVGAQGQQISQTNPANWLSCDDAIVALAMLGQVPGAPKTYALGFYYTAQPCGYWFYDIDGCVNPVTGEMNADGREALARFPGAAWEISTSGRGIHILGRGEVPKHDKISRSSPGHELYDAAHQIAFGFGYGEQVRGDVDLVWSVEHMARLVSEKFAPVSSTPVVSGLLEQLKRADALESVTPEVIEHLRSALRHLATQGDANAGQYHAWDAVRQNLICLGDTGFDLFVEFSNLGDKPSDNEALRQKFYEAGGGDKSTYKSIFHRASATGWVNPLARTAGALDRSLATTPISRVAMISAYESKMRSANGTTPEELYAVAAEIAADNNIERQDKLGPLAKKLHEAFKNCGFIYGLDAIKDMVAPASNRLISEFAWLEGWVWLTFHDRYYHKTLARSGVSVTSFNVMFNRHVGEDASAHEVVSKNLNIRHVTKHMYAPSYPEFFEYRGETCINSYRADSAPVARQYATQEESDAITRVLSHIQMLCGDQYEAMVDWIAFNVQHPGVKIRFAPVIKGFFGDGKSGIATLLRAILGDENVNVISNSVLSRAFTDWSFGASVGFVEELKVSGRDKHAVSDNLKEYITNDVISVNPKGLKSFDAINTMNYIATTNYEDALPIQTGDRRWWIIFSPFKSKADLEAHVGETEGYFTPFFNAIKGHATVLRHYFVTHQISESFKPNAAAPMTVAKNTMQEASEGGLTRDAKEIIEAGDVGISRTVISTQHFNSALSESRGEKLMHTKTLSNLLDSLGFVRFKKLRWERSMRTIYVISENKLSEDEIRKLLDETLTFGVNFGQ